MHERDRNRALADPRRHPLHRAVPNITDDKDAWHVCFQKPRIAIELPTVGPLAIACEMRAGVGEAALVALHDFSKPVSVWRCTDHDEQPVGGNFAYLVRLSAVN